MNIGGRNVSRAIPLALAAIVLTGGGASAKLSNSHVTAGETPVVASGGFRPWFPDVVKLSDRLVLAYRWGTTHAGSLGSIRMRQSFDLGTTWSDTTNHIVISDSTYDYRDPSLTLLASGKLLLTYFRCEPLGTGCRNDGTSPIKSYAQQITSSGSKVGSAIEITSSNIWWAATQAKIAETAVRTADPAATGPAICRAAARDLLIPLYGDRFGNTIDKPEVSVVVRWREDGTSSSGFSKCGETVVATAGANGAPANWSFQEPAIAEIAPLHLRVVLRTDGGTKTAASEPDDTGYARDSLDGGRTWGNLYSLGVPVHAPEILPVPGTTKIFNAWSRPMDTPWSNAYAVIRPVQVRIADPCCNWHTAGGDVELGITPNLDMGYSSTVALDASGSLYTVYYDSVARPTSTSPDGALIGRRTRLADWQRTFTPINLSTGITSTNMSYVSSGTTPCSSGPTKVFDGRTDYWCGAFRDPAAPNPTGRVPYFEIRLDQVRSISRIGVSLKPPVPTTNVRQRETATVKVSTDGIFYTTVRSFVQADTYGVVDTAIFDSPVSAQWVLVEVTGSDGWASLNELQLWS